MRVGAPMGKRTEFYASSRARAATRCLRCGSFVLKRGILPDKVVESSLATTTVAGSTAVMQHFPRGPMVSKCVCISWCACLGTLARIYTDDIRPSNLALQGSFLPNSLGSFALGALTASNLSEDTLPGLYIGLTVGLCGSYTTYSGWNLRLARGALGDASGPGGAIVTVAAIVKSLAFFAACFVAGGDLMKTLANRGLSCRWRLSNNNGSNTTSTSNNTSAGRALGVMGAVYAVLAVLLCVDDSRSRRIRWLACAFAPFGALSRFFLSR